MDQIYLNIQKLEWAKVKETVLKGNEYEGLNIKIYFCDNKVCIHTLDYILTLSVYNFIELCDSKSYANKIQ